MHAASMDRRRLGAAALRWAAALSLAPTLAAAAAGEWTDAPLGLRFTLPAGATAQRDGLIPDMQWQLTPAGRDATPEYNALRIHFAGADPGRNFAHFVVHLKATHGEAALRSANIRPPAVQELPALDVGGQPGFRFRVGLPASAIIGERVIVFANGRQYSLELNAEREHHARLLPQWEQMLRSLRFTR